MAFSAILRRSANKAAPLVSCLIGTQRNFLSSAAVVSAVKGASLSPQFLRSAACYPIRQFSSSVATNPSSSNSELLDVLQSEINIIEESEEHDETVEVPEGFPFEIEDNVGVQTVTLTRQYEGETISVEVSMPSLVTGEEDEDENEDDDEDEKDETSKMSSLPLLVTLIKKDGSGLEFDCTAYPDEISINSLSLKNPETEDQQLAYEGPDFLELDEKLQKAYHKYLEIRGIKPSTTNFLHEYMIEKDKKEYRRWFKDVKKFVEA